MKTRSQQQLAYEFIFLKEPLDKKGETPLDEGLYMYISIPASQCWQYGLKPKGFVCNVLTMFGDIARDDFNDEDIALLQQAVQVMGSVTTTDTTKICKPGRGRVLRVEDDDEEKR